MSGVEKIPLRVPRQWDPEWFTAFVRDVLSKMDTRNSVGVGVSITSDGNSVATIDVTATIDDAIDAHDAEVTAHAPAIAAHDADPDAHAEQIEDALDVHRVETDPHAELIDDLPQASAVYDTDRVLVGQDGKHRTGRLDQVRDLMFGDHWTDLVIPAVAINPLGAANPPTLNNNTGCLEFSASADNVVIFSWQIPHGWSGEFDSTKAVVVPHLHVRGLTSTAAPNNVSRWKLEYDVADANGTFTNAYASWTTVPTVSFTNPANTAKCQILSFGDLDLAGYGASTILHCRVSRLAGTDATDTDSSVIALYSADLHIQHRAAGTVDAVPSTRVRPASGRVRIVGQS